MNGFWKRHGFSDFFKTVGKPSKIAFAGDEMPADGFVTLAFPLMHALLCHLPRKAKFAVNKAYQNT